MVCKRILVRGKVQGVGFRYYTQQQAQMLKITGWVRNLENGQVEILAQGSEQDVEALLNWAHQGSPSARVDEVDISEDSGDDIGDEGFQIRS